MRIPDHNIKEQQQPPALLLLLILLVVETERDRTQRRGGGTFKKDSKADEVTGQTEGLPRRKATKCNCSKEKVNGPVPLR